MKRIPVLVIVAAVAVGLACTPSPSPKVTPSPTPRVTATPTVTATPRITASPTVAPTPTPRPSPSPTVAPTPVPTPTFDPCGNGCLTPSPVPTPKPTPVPPIKTLPPTTTNVLVAPSVSVVLVSTCEGWTATVTYSGFVRGDVLAGGFIDDSLPSSDGFWNQGLWEGSGSEVMASGGPSHYVKVMTEVNPYGQIDPDVFANQPPGNVVGNGAMDGHPTVTEATLSGCPA